MRISQNTLRQLTPISRQFFSGLKASQILMTRTQEAILILSIAGAFYFALSYPISYYATRLEQRWSE